MAGLSKEIKGRAGIFHVMWKSRVTQREKKKKTTTTLRKRFSRVGKTSRKSVLSIMLYAELAKCVKTSLEPASFARVTWDQFPMSSNFRNRFLGFISYFRRDPTLFHSRKKDSFSLYTRTREWLFSKLQNNRKELWSSYSDLRKSRLKNELNFVWEEKKKRFLLVVSKNDGTFDSSLLGLLLNLSRVLHLFV